MKTSWLVTTKVHIGLQLHRLAGVSEVQSHWAPVNGCLQSLVILQETWNLPCVTSPSITLRKPE